jgi:hypothetical protein
MHRNVAMLSLIVRTQAFVNGVIPVSVVFLSVFEEYLFALIEAVRDGVSVVLMALSIGGSAPAVSTFPSIKIGPPPLGTATL